MTRMNTMMAEYENIIKENNTAQLQLIHLLENTPKNITELLIHDVFHGNVDFSILEEKGFNQLRSVVFSMKGEVTDIIGLPNNIETLICNNQFLLQLTQLPTQLKELQCNDNFIKHIDLTKCKKLKVLKASNNHIDHLENIPTTLEELHCDNNQLKTLNLIELTKLRVLHTSNNKTLIIIGLPPSVIDFVSENNPYIEIERCIEGEGDEKTPEEKQVKVNYLESINEYFKLKNKYETKLRELQRKNAQNAKKNKTGKKSRKFQELQPKCINCGKTGGTIFSNKNYKYTAVCGNTTQPCNLNIEIYRAEFADNDEFMNISKGAIEDLKNDIIRKKMDAVFNYATHETANRAFKKLINEHNTYDEIHRELVNKHNDMFYGEVRKECIEKKTAHVSEIILAVKKLLNEYKKTNNLSILKTAVEIQIKELQPEINNLRLLKYEIMEMNPVKLQKRMQNVVNTFDEIRGEPTVMDGEDGGGGGVGGNADANNGSSLFQMSVALHKREHNLVNVAPKVIKYTR